MKRCLVVILLVSLAGCSKQEDDKTSGTDPTKQVMLIDKQAKAGRVFMYVDDSGEVVKTDKYEEIPPSKRSAVMVIEGKKRARITRSAGGEVNIQALPPTISAEEKAGHEEAAALLKENPPEGKGPPSTEKWNDEQWRDELKKEMEELRKEQEETE
jgi:hypothetical protein